MKVKKILLALILIFTFIISFILCRDVSSNNKNHLTLTGYNEFKKELMKNYEEIYNIELSYWHIGVELLISTTDQIPYNKQVNIYNSSRKYLVDNYNEIDDFFIEKNKFCSRLRVSISPKELKGTYIYSNYYTLKDNQLDYFKTWSYSDISTHKTTKFIRDNKGVERIYPNVKEEIRRRENIGQ